MRAEDNSSNILKIMMTTGIMKNDRKMDRKTKRA
jgi:hypothetical protein